MDLAPLNLGMISAYYYLKYTTVELFSSSLTAKTKMKNLIESLANASEYDDLPIRAREATQLRKMATLLPLKTDTSDSTDPHTKASIMMQAHFSRRPLPPDLDSDRQRVVGEAIRLL